MARTKNTRILGHILLGLGIGLLVINIFIQAKGITIAGICSVILSNVLQEDGVYGK